MIHAIPRQQLQIVDIIVPEYEPRPPFGPRSWSDHQALWGWFPRYYEIPTTRERIMRCREMGLLLCTCHGIDDGDRHLLIHSPWCRVHQIFEKVRRVYLFC